jgi:hypothetical protein
LYIKAHGTINGEATNQNKQKEPQGVTEEFF